MMNFMMKKTDATFLLPEKSLTKETQFEAKLIRTKPLSALTEYTSSRTNIRKKALWLWPVFVAEVAPLNSTYVLRTPIIFAPIAVSARKTSSCHGLYVT